EGRRHRGRPCSIAAVWWLNQCADRSWRPRARARSTWSQRAADHLSGPRLPSSGTTRYAPRRIRSISPARRAVRSAVGRCSRATSISDGMLPAWPRGTVPVPTVHRLVPSFGTSCRVRQLELPNRARSAERDPPPHAEGPGPLAERADRGPRWPEPASAGDDLELDLGRHLGVEADRRGVDTGRLDRLADLDLALVDRRATGRL